MKRLSLCWACIAVLVGFGKSATGQSTSTLAGQVDLPRLVDAAAQRLRVNIEYDASALKGQVTLRLEGGLSDEELWQLVNRVLAARGFTTVRQSSAAGSPPAYSVVKLSDAPAVAGLTLAPEGSGPAAPGSGGPPAGFHRDR